MGGRPRIEVNVERIKCLMAEDKSVQEIAEALKKGGLEISPSTIYRRLR